ncbi:helix-turn-helix transcriptional regulator [Glaciecola punicea]|uniref:helix-turn-helix transcriptional regulator n=1 Tax=Glaciecola punicea TaxID=56804 RepID=UPI00245467DA|nr:AlpA family transcriptional regulator [Glaciecola punicea]
MLRKEEVTHLCGISVPYMYSMISAETFPKPVKLGIKISGWVDTEVQQWIEQRIADRDNT